MSPDHTSGPWPLPRWLVRPGPRRSALGRGSVVGPFRRARVPTWARAEIRPDVHTEHQNTIDGPKPAIAGASGGSPQPWLRGFVPRHAHAGTKLERWRRPRSLPGSKTGVLMFCGHPGASQDPARTPPRPTLRVLAKRAPQRTLWSKLGGLRARSRSGRAPPCTNPRGAEAVDRIPSSRSTISVTKRRSCQFRQRRPTGRSAAVARARADGRPGPSATRRSRRTGWRPPARAARGTGRRRPASSGREAGRSGSSG